MREKLPKKLGDYKFALDVAGDVSRNVVIRNSNHNKAEYAMSKIFELAKKDLYIFAGDMSCDNVTRSDTYIRNIINFLKEDTSNKVNIILENDNPNSESLNILKILKAKDDFKDQIFLRILNSESLIKKTKHNEKFHFSVNPTKGIYRFEFDISKRKALLNFNDYEYSEKLKTLFDYYYLNSSEIDYSHQENNTIALLEQELNDLFLVA